MGKLTNDALRALKFISLQPLTAPVLGPAPGWNCDCILDLDEPVDGVDLQALFNLGLVVATPIPPPHTDDFNEDSGSLVRDHAYSITDAGRATLTTHKDDLVVLRGHPLPILR